MTGKIFWPEASDSAISLGMRVALIDHYDSFTFNVLDWLRGWELSVDYVAYDDPKAMAELARSPRPLVLSPGPKRPEDALPTLALTRALLGRVPILGICLGHQLLAVATGGSVSRGQAPQHGTTRALQLTGQPGLLRSLPSGTRVGVYNSLVVEPASLRDWDISAYCELGEVQAMVRRVAGQAPAFGLQFHPESFLSEGAAVIRRNWLAALNRPSSLAAAEIPPLRARKGQHSATAPLEVPS